MSIATLPPTSMTRISSSMRLPMTEGAWRALASELAELTSATDDRFAGAPDRAERERRVAHLRSLLDTAALEAASDRAVVGRRVRVREDDGSEAAYSLVIPGDGDPQRGWIGADAPMGAALLGARTGERVMVMAPAGERWLTVLGVD